MLAAYLTPAQARDRLAPYGFARTPTAQVLSIASDTLDEMARAGFVGDPYDPEQPRQFPRTITLSGDTEAVVPDRILDWVALQAYALSTEDDAPVKAERVDELGRTYGGKGKIGRTKRLMKPLLKPYRSRGGHAIA